MFNSYGMWEQSRKRPAAPHPYMSKKPRPSYEIRSGSESDRAEFRVDRDSNSTIPHLELTPMSPGFGGHHHVVGPQSIGMGGWRQIPLPPDASPTLFVEGIPATCSRREVSQIFRPFLGYMETRLVTKESRHPGGGRLVLCFVDFQSPAHAATALDALQGYKFDEHERDSACLGIQFARQCKSRRCAS